MVEEVTETEAPEEIEIDGDEATEDEEDAGGDEQE